jgi:hypothetical protein
MAEDRKPDPRRMLLGSLLQKVEDDNYPSVAMLDLIEGMLQPDEVPVYLNILLQKVRAETYPSIPILQRLSALV